MKLYFSKQLNVATSDVANAINVVENSLSSVREFSVSLTMEDRRKRRKMGPRRLAYATEAVRKGKQFENVMPRTFIAADFEQLLSLYKDVADLLGKVEELRESLDDTLMAIGIDAMTFTKLVHDGLRSANTLDPRFDTSLRELDGFNKRALEEETDASKMSIIDTVENIS